MIDWLRITGFDWDDGNARKNVEKHDVGQAESEQVFLNSPLLISSDGGHSLTERRWNALGHTSEGRTLHVTFTLRDDDRRIRVISARDMNRKERKQYDQ